MTASASMSLGMYPEGMNWLSAVAIGVSKDFNFLVDQVENSLEFRALSAST